MGHFKNESVRMGIRAKQTKLGGFRLLTAGAAAVLLVALVAVVSPATTAVSGASNSKVTIGVDLTMNDTAFWAAYINYEQQDAQKMGIKLLGPLLAGDNASLQNQQIEDLVNEGAKSIIVNPETATSLAPAINYATAHHVKLISVDTIVGAGKVYMVVRASNTLYGQDACAYMIAEGVKSGTVVDLEGDLTSSNGADRTNAFNQCMAKNDPHVKIISDPTMWTDVTAVNDAQNAINAYGGQLKGIYAQWSAPIPAIISDLHKANISPLLIGDDGVPYEMCDIGKSSESASQSQPANLYAQYALAYALDAAKGMVLKAGQAGGGAPKLQYVTYHGDKNLADPIVAPFVTKTVKTMKVANPVDGLPATTKTVPITDKLLWGNVYGAAHGGVCSTSTSS